MSKLPNVFNAMNTFRVKHEPEILMGMGIAGLTFSVVWGIKTTIKMTHKYDEECANKNKSKLTFGETFKLCWKAYLPVAVATCVSIPCIIAGNKVSSKRNAALAAAYTISETALQEYKDKAKEVLGDEKVKKIEQAIDQEKVDKSPQNSKEVIICGEGEQIFLESLTGRYFKSDWNFLQQTANQMNEGCLLGNSMAFTVNQWLDMIGVGGTDRLFDQLGWGIDTLGGRQSLLKIRMSTCKTSDNKACCVLAYDVLPEKI